MTEFAFEFIGLFLIVRTYLWVEFDMFIVIDVSQIEFGLGMVEVHLRFVRWNLFYS